MLYRTVITHTIKNGVEETAPIDPDHNLKHALGVAELFFELAGDTVIKQVELQSLPDSAGHRAIAEAYGRAADDWTTEAVFATGEQLAACSRDTADHFPRNLPTGEVEAKLFGDRKN